MNEIRKHIRHEPVNEPSRALIVTTINAPNEALRKLASGAVANEIPFFVIGDTKSPEDFSLAGAQFVSLQEQDARYPAFSRALPRSHYVRKNIGYLLALETRANEIQETDDDNIPTESFWTTSSVPPQVVHTSKGWFNVYSLFSTEFIWPRGFPLENLNQTSSVTLQEVTNETGMIHQALADENPDVDAIFRLTRPLPVTFKQRSPVLLPSGIWCPFNSQNTIFSRVAFPLLYLPSCCTFRMTDIWRSFVAQRCIWELGGAIVFHSSTVRQERNEHSLLRDFEDEVPGYLLNNKIRLALEALSLDGKDMLRSLSQCYEALVKQKVVLPDELEILSQWERAIERLL